MIRRIQALNYRCLRYVDVSLDRFHVLVGANASGKSTLFDVVAFLGDLVFDGIEAAVEERTSNFHDLLWGRRNPDESKIGARKTELPDARLSVRDSSTDVRGFELALEFDIPKELREKLPEERHYRIFRYEVAIRETDGDVRIESERGILLPKQRKKLPKKKKLFPGPLSPPDSILVGGNRRGWRTVLSKSKESKDNFNIETSSASGKGWATSIAFGPRRSALGNLPESPDKFPVATYIKQLLTYSIKMIFLDSLKMRRASPPNLRRYGFASDGSNLPWAIKLLQDKYDKDYEEWLSHVQTTFSDLEGIRVVEREDDRHAYLMLRYKTGVEAPSWMVSDGTLRFLALTLLAYLPNSGETYLLEEPENGIHPMALDPVYDSLTSVYDSQVLVATHSPAFLSLVEPQEVLCFAKDFEGATDIIRGNSHPHLKNWQGAADMNLLFATGVIG